MNIIIQQQEQLPATNTTAEASLKQLTPVTAKRKLIFDSGGPGVKSPNSLSTATANPYQQHRFNTIGPSPSISEAIRNFMNNNSNDDGTSLDEKCRDLTIRNYGQNHHQSYSNYGTVKRIQQLIKEEEPFMKKDNGNDNSMGSMAGSSTMRKRHKLMRNVFDTVKISSTCHGDANTIYESISNTQPKTFSYGSSSIATATASQSKKRVALDSVLESFQSAANPNPGANADEDAMGHSIFNAEQLKELDKRRTSDSNWIEILADKDDETVKNSEHQNEERVKVEKTLYQRGKNWFKTLGRKEGVKVNTIKKKSIMAALKGSNKNAAPSTPSPTTDSRTQKTLLPWTGTVKFLRNPLSTIRLHYLKPVSSGKDDDEKASARVTMTDQNGQDVSARVAREKPPRPAQEIREEDKENLTEEELSMLLQQINLVPSKRSNRMTLNEVVDRFSQQQQQL